MWGRLVAALLVVAMLGGITVYASSGKAVNTVRKTAAQSDGKTVVSLEQAMKIAREAYPGSVIKAEEEHGLYEIKIRTENGEIVKVKIDPADGSMVSFRKKTGNH